MVYKIGQILTSNQDVEVEKALSGEKVIIPKGNKIIIGPDELAHHMYNGMIQPLGENIEVKGYDAAGIAKYLCFALGTYFPLEKMLEEYGFDMDALQDELEYALDDIGF